MPFAARRLVLPALMTAILLHDFTGHAKAQAPSNSCAREQAACLRASVRQGLYGAEFVPPEDVARCTVAYQACLNPDPCMKARAACLQGAVRKGPFGEEYVPPEDAARCHEAYRLCAPGRDSALSPQQQATPPMKRFEVRIGSGGGGATVSDCRVNGVEVTCTSRWENPPPELKAFTGKFTGRLLGATLTGTTTSHLETLKNGCLATEDYSGPATYVLNPGGTAALRAGPIQRQSKFNGGCSGASSGSSGIMEATVNWRKLD